jgi:hypothetical protein
MRGVDLSVTKFRLVAAVVIALCIAAPAHAQTVNRVNVPAGDATPTGASFSVRMPVEYSDVELRAEDPPAPTAIVRMVTGVSGDQIRFSASEMPYLAGIEPKPVEDFMNAMKEKSGAELSDVHHDKPGATETLSFTLIDIAGGGNYFDVVRANAIQYVLVVQFHRAQRDEAAAMKDAFFGSFKITQ